MIVSIIAAVSKNNVIGMDENIPWKIPGEQLRFKHLTLGKSIIMGRKTYESIGSPLPGRKTIVISRSQDIKDKQCITVKSLEEAFHLLKDEHEIFIAGGGQIYAEALPYSHKIYLTIIDDHIDGNIFFPEIDREKFNITFQERIEASIPYTYYTFERK